MADKVWVGGTADSETDWGTAANWSPSGVPVNGDDVYIDGASSSNYNISDTLDQSAVTLASLTIYDNYQGQIGTKTAYLQVGATICNLHVPTNTPGSGSGRIKLDFGSVQTTCAVYGSARGSLDAGLAPIRLLGTHASNTLSVTGRGSVGVAVGSGAETSTIATTTVASRGGIPKVTFGQGCTLTTINISAGIVLNQGAATTTVGLTGGKYVVDGTRAATTINARGGVVEYNSTGTLTTAVVSGGALFDMSGDSRAKTVTNMTVNRGAFVNLDNGNPLSITITNGIDLNDCSIQDVSLITWKHLTVSLSSI